MKSLRRIFGMMLLLSSLILGGEPVATVIYPGEFHGDEMPAVDHSLWLGLFPRHGHFEWRPTRISVRAVHDPIADETTDRPTGREIRARAAVQPVLLVQGLHGLPRRPIHAAASVERVIAPDAPWTASGPDGRPAEIRMERPGTPAPSGEQPAQLVLTIGGERQILFAWQHRIGDEAASLVWAGDLDGDGRLDLWMNLSDHYNVAEYRLFLSSRRAAGELVHPVVTRRTTGC